MHSMDDALESLVNQRIVDPEEAYNYVQNKGRFEKLFQVR